MLRKCSKHERCFCISVHAFQHITKHMETQFFRSLNLNYLTCWRGKLLICGVNIFEPLEKLLCILCDSDIIHQFANLIEPTLKEYVCTLSQHWFRTQRFSSELFYKWILFIYIGFTLVLNWESVNIKTKNELLPKSHLK